jgi:PAS domain S-box-containing protein
VEKAKIATPFGYLIKPVDDRALKISINMALYKKALDENIKRQQKIIRALLNATTDALFIVDRDGIILGLNESLAKRAQKVSDGLLNTSFFELIPAGAISTRLAEEVRNSANGVQKRFVEEFSARWFDNNIFPITDSDGTVTMIAVFSNDITDLKKAENDLMVAHNNLLKEKERLLVMTSALDTMDDIVIITDAMGNISYVNTSFVKKLGYTANEMQHRHIGEIQYPGDPFAIDKTAFIAKSQTAWMGNLALKNKYNLKIKTSLRSSPVMMDNRLICRVFVLREQP